MNLLVLLSYNFRDWQLLEKGQKEAEVRTLHPAPIVLKLRSSVGVFIVAFKFTQLATEGGNGAPFTDASVDCPNIL